MISENLSSRLANDAVVLVRKWLIEAQNYPVDFSAKQLAGILKDPNGLAFTVGFVDGVVRPEDLHVAARKLATLAPTVPSFLPWYLRAAVRFGGLLAPLMPALIIPLSRRVLRNMVGHLIVDATDAKLGDAISTLRREGIRLNINLLGEAVLGEREATRRLEGTRTLLRRDDVDYVSLKVSSTQAPHSPWAFDETVEHLVEHLLPLYELAAASATPKFINLDMEEFKDLDITLEVFTRILNRPHLVELEAGIVLQAYLPDALAAMMRLQKFSAARRAHGGACIKVRVVKGANLPMERVEATLHDWPLATLHSKQETDTNYKRVLNYALESNRIDNVRVGVAGHNLFDVAFAWLLAQERGVTHGIEFEMLQGMAQGQAEAVKRDVGGLLLYTPLVHPAEFDVAIAYLIRRLEEGASHDNFMSAVFELAANEPLFEREEGRFRASLAELDDVVPVSHRAQNRFLPVAPMPTNAFHNTADTDPAIAANRVWGRAILAHAAASTLGIDTVEASMVSNPGELEAVFAIATSEGAHWSALSAEARAEVLHRAGEILEARRADLMEVMASEAGKTLDQSDPEVSEAIDFAHYYAEQAKELGRISGANFTPAKLIAVIPPWNFPVAIPAGSTLAALAAGSHVVIKPAALARRCGAVMVEALWEAGVPRSALQLVNVTTRELASALVADPRVERVILTGGYETAEHFRSLREDLPLLAETSGKNSIIITPSADLDLAVKDVISSAFGHAGQKCSATSLVILVGSVASSERFSHQLVDGVTSLTVAYATNPLAQMGPLIEPAHGKLLNALTTLDTGETWLVAPQQLDDTGTLWTPGVREGVASGSHFHMTEYFGPVLGIMTAATLLEAIALANAVDFGLTAGIHSLDSKEIGLWLQKIQSGNLYVNRGTTGAIVRRQPFGGWKKSAVGAGSKAGGPNYLFGLGTWGIAASADGGVTPVHEHVLTVIDALNRSGLLSGGELAWIRQAASLDQYSWSTELGIATDVSQLGVERNVFRYRPLPVQIRLTETGNPVELMRVVLAGLRAGSNFTISAPTTLPDGILWALNASSLRVDQRSDESWLTVLKEDGRELSGTRIRLIGGSAESVTRATAGRPDIAVYAGDVVLAGRIESLVFLREQAISITAHRFGSPNHLTDALI